VEEKLTYIMMVPIHNLHGEYGHCTVKQTYKNVLNNVVKVTNALSVSMTIPYIPIRIMEDTGSCDGRNVNYPWLNRCTNVP
jgi:hypothetical protein